MAKKKPAKSGGNRQNKASDRSKLIKVWLSDEESRLLRLASALEDQRPSDFVRDAALAKASTVESSYIAQRAKG